jgi:hypothetical protein
MKLSVHPPLCSGVFLLLFSFIIMATSFFSEVKKATPNSCVKLIKSPLWENYRKIDDSLIDYPVLRMEAVKAFFRSYQNFSRNLDYTIEEVEALICMANSLNTSTDKYFDAILKKAKENEKCARFLFSTFAYLRNELKSL